MTVKGNVAVRLLARILLQAVLDRHAKDQRATNSGAEARAASPPPLHRAEKEPGANPKPPG